MGQKLKLRQVCDPNEKVDFVAEHKHLCDCGTCWKHSNDLPRGSRSRKNFELAHSCPNCGNDVRLKHDSTPSAKDLDRLFAKLFEEI